MAMTPLGDWFSKFIPLKVWLILGALKNLLNAGSTATGAYSKEPAPTFQKPQMFLEGVKGKIVKNEITEVLAKASDAQVEAGMSHTQAALIAGFATILTAAIQGLDFSLLFSDPKKFASSLFTGMVVAWATYLQEPNRSKVDIGSNRKVNETAKVYDSLKVNAELPEPKE